jgi:hypothetical protein
MKKAALIPTIVLALSFIGLIGLPAAASAVEVGDKAPDFDLPSTKGGKFRLSGLEGKKNVVVQFYVLDFSPT